MRSQPASIVWTVTSKAAFDHCWYDSSQVWFKIVFVFKKTALSIIQISKTSNLEQSDSLVYCTRALDI